MSRPPRAGPTFSGQRARQDAAELAKFIALLKAEGVRSYGEIGAWTGDTMMMVLNGLPKGSKGVAVDYPGGPWGKDTTRAPLEQAVARLVADGYDASCLFGDSRSAATIRAFIGRGPYDAILIDGDHRLEAVAADWANYGRLAKIVAFHDIKGEGQKDCNGYPVDVPLFWKSIRSNGHRTVEFFTPGSKMGIGVIWT